MEHFATKPHCPACAFTRFWKIRRNHRKCKRCRHEWSAIPVLRKGFQVTVSVWRKFLHSFLWERTGYRISHATGIEQHRVYRMALLVRQCMATDIPPPFVGTVEIDETYIGGSQYNKRKSEKTGKRGHGTSKQAILGMYHRETKHVVTILIPNLKTINIVPNIHRHVCDGSRICTDTFMIYGKLKNWYQHEHVNHLRGEYVRGDIHTNSIEGFWGCLKRQLRSIGGIRRSRLWLYVAEQTWRHNHRSLSLDEQVEILLNLVAES
jgi:transposase-like protein